MVFDKMRWLLLLLLLLAGCGGMMDDLNPSSANKVTPSQPGTIGPAVGQIAPDFTLSDTLGNSVTLSSELTTTNTKGVVLFYTMWCPLCDGDMTNMRNSFVPAFPNVRFFAVDYVSGSVAAAAGAEQDNGFAGSGITVLADTQNVLNLYQATMETTVVIDRTGVVRMNESYKNGARLQTVLSGLP
jgi:peroxiredoxin